MIESKYKILQKEHKTLKGHHDFEVGTLKDTIEQLEKEQENLVRKLNYFESENYTLKNKLYY